MVVASTGDTNGGKCKEKEDEERGTGPGYDGTDEGSRCCPEVAR